LGEKLAVFIEFKKKILRTKVLRMTAKGFLINVRKKTTLFVILSEAKNLILLLNFSPDAFKYIIINWIWGRYGFDGKRRAKGSMP